MKKRNRTTFLTWDTAPCSPLKSTDVSAEHVASIFRVEKYSKEETGMKQEAGKSFLPAFFMLTACLQTGLT
jgi:hypothetical protein